MPIDAARSGDLENHVFHKQIQKKDERTAAQREVDAQYGRTPWNKKGSLGT